MKNFLFFIFLFTYNFSFSQQKEVSIKNVKQHLSIISKNFKNRNYKNITVLNKTANYIKQEFEKLCDTTYFEKYNVGKNEYKNVVGSIGRKNKTRIIIGAHYDVFGNSQGADDNASGVVGLLELARLLFKQNLKYRIDFVAYTLEEPPFFRTKQMGSYVHAKYLFNNKIPVLGMLCLESIGYYNNKSNSQTFPIKEMSLLYGNKGDFITVVQNNKAGSFSNLIKDIMQAQNLIKTKFFKGPSLVSGVDFSDHLNYWKFNYDAVMITNTAFYRNKNYHTSKDTIETLDINKMSLVIQQLYQTIIKIATKN